MPSKNEKIALSDPFLKRSAKLLPCQKEMVIYWHNKGFSQRNLAKMFNVSRRLITFIINPKALEESNKRREERGGSKIYYDKEKHKKAIKKLRDYKKELFS